MAKKLECGMHVATGKFPESVAKDLRYLTDVSIFPRVTGERGYASPKEIPQKEYVRLTEVAARAVLDNLQKGNFRRNKTACGIAIKNFEELKIGEPQFGYRYDSTDGKYYLTVKVFAKARGYVLNGQNFTTNRKTKRENKLDRIGIPTLEEDFECEIDFSGIDEDISMFGDDTRYFQVAENELLGMQRTTCDIRGEHSLAKFRERNL